MTFDGRLEGQFTVPASTTISVTTNAGGPTTVTIAAGTYFLSAFITYLESALIAQRSVSGGTWSVSLSTGSSATGKVTIAVTNGTYSITWTSTVLRDLLGFTGNLSSVATSTGSNQARGLWIPDCPISMESDPAQAPRKSDLRTSESPTGIMFGYVGNFKYRHRNVVWSAVEKARVWLGSETTVNASLERFLIDIQWGTGLSWFTPLALVTIYDHSGAKVGINANSGTGVTGWYLKGFESLEPRKTGGDWTGLWAIEIPEIIASS